MSNRVVGVDACSAGWFATVLSDDDVTTACFENFADLAEEYSDAVRILVDIPIGLPTNSRRRCDVAAKDLLGCRGSSVFYPPCVSAAEKDDYDDANAEHRDQMGHGLSQQAHAISQKIIEVEEVVDDTYDGQIRESHPELCFYALNGQPIAYSKSSERGRELRLDLLESELGDARAIYEQVLDETYRKDVARDDVLDSMVLAIAAQNGTPQTAPEMPEDDPRIYYPERVEFQ